jgi:hypothetical protein
VEKKKHHGVVFWAAQMHRKKWELQTQVKNIPELKQQLDVKTLGSTTSKGVFTIGIVSFRITCFLLFVRESFNGAFYFSLNKGTLFTTSEKIELFAYLANPTVLGRREWTGG